MSCSKRKVFLLRLLFLQGMIITAVLCGGCGNAGEAAMAEASNRPDTTQETLSENDMEAGGLADNGAQEAVLSVQTDDQGTEAQSLESGEAVADKESVSGNDVEQRQNDTDSADEDEQPGEDGGMEDTRREPVRVKGIYVSGPVAGTGKMESLITLVEETELNAMVIDIKNDEGKVTYEMQSEQVMEIGAGTGYISDIDGLVAQCKEKGIYLIARIVAFRDPYLAEKKPEWAVHTNDGEIFRDKSGLAWVNPYEHGVWDYLAEIGAEAAKAGFDEIQFDYIRFSTDIREEEIDYGEEAEQTDKIGIITQFTEYMYGKLAPLGVYVAADVFGTVIDNETDQKIVGQDYVQMAGHLDYICPMVYPSHYHNGAYGIPVPDADPYQTIYRASTASVEELAAVPDENRAGVRMWLQGFTASWVPGHISYGAQQLRDQIKGAYFAGYDEWIVWNAAVNYKRTSFLTDEEAEDERAQWEEEKEKAVQGEVPTPQTEEKQPEGQGNGQPETVSGNG